MREYSIYSYSNLSLFFARSSAATIFWWRRAYQALLFSLFAFSLPHFLLAEHTRCPVNPSTQVAQCSVHFSSNAVSMVSLRTNQIGGSSMTVTTFRGFPLCSGGGRTRTTVSSYASCCSFRRGAVGKSDTPRSPLFRSPSMVLNLLSFSPLRGLVRMSAA